jgi:hypothetical protein
VGSLTVLRDREFPALSGTAFARAPAYSTIAIALALYADLFNTSSTVEGPFGTAFALVQLLVVLPSAGTSTPTTPSGFSSGASSSTSSSSGGTSSPTPSRT